MDWIFFLSATTIVFGFGWIICYAMLHDERNLRRIAEKRAGAEEDTCKYLRGRLRDSDRRMASELKFAQQCNKAQAATIAAHQKREDSIRLIVGEEG